MEVLICGAGIAGLTLALCLERRGHRAWIVEQAPRLRDDGYMIDFFGSGFDAMERLDLLPDLTALHEPIDRIEFRDAAGRLQVSIPYATLRKRLFYDRHFNFMRGRLERLLRTRLPRASTIRFGTTVESFHDDGARVQVRLSDRTTHVVDLLVGADGVHSRIRTLLLGEHYGLRTLGYEAIAFIIDRPPAVDIGDAFVTVTAPRHQAALYPTADGRLATFFLHEVKPGQASVSRTRPCQTLRLLYQDIGWVVPHILEQGDHAQSIYVDAVQQVDLPHWSSGNVVLVGDACQCVSPLAGQGASMAVAGAYILAERLAEESGRAAALTAYQDTLKPAITQQQEAARRIAQWFVPASLSRLWLRNMVTRMSTLAPVASILRRRMAAGSVFLQQAR